MNVAIYGLVALFGVMLLVYGTRVVVMVGNQLTEVLRWPSSVYYASVPIAGALYALYSAHRIVEIAAEKECGE
jgi:TRAP-type C4-dicarboxylate transport system permease small subunit